MKLRRLLRGDTLVEVMFAVGIFGAVAIGAITLMNKGVNTSQTTLETTMARQEIDAQSEALRFIHGAYIAESSGLKTAYSDAWDSITERAYSEATVQEEVADFFTKETTGGRSCADLFSKRPVKAFALNSHNLNLGDGSPSGDVLVADAKLQSATTYPRMLYGYDEAAIQDLSDYTIDENGVVQTISRDYLYAAEGIWVTNVASDAGGNDEDGVFQPDFYDFYVQTCWDQAGSGEASTISSIIRLYNPKRIVHDAQLDAYSFALVYNANGGAGAPPTQIDDNITASTHTFRISDLRPTYVNYNFLGWSTNKTASHANYQPGDTITVDKRSTTLYAVWQRLHTYILIYDANGGSGAPASPSYGPTADTDHTFDISTTIPTRPGYRFLGWSASSSATSAQYTAGSSVKVTSESATLYAVWQRLYTHTLNYDANGGFGAPAAQVYDDTVSSHTFRVSSAVPVRSNYRFLGWATTSSATSAEYTGGDYISVGTSITLYAVWQRIHTVTLSYDANGGFGAPASSGPVELSSSYYEFTISTTIPTRFGYTFLGWSTSKTAATASYAGGDKIRLLANTTLYAVWRYYYDFTLHYDANGGSGAPADQSSGPQNASSFSFTVSATVPTRSNYRFLGWATTSSASSPEYYGGNSLSVTSEGTTTLYAVWRMQYRFSLAYNANGGSGAPASQDSGYVSTSSHTFTISTTAPTRSGYSFLGWSTSSTATTPSYYSGGTIEVSADTKLYAVWRANNTMQSFACNNLTKGSTRSLRDERDSKQYQVVRLSETGDCWMTEDLKFLGTSLSTSDSDVVRDRSITYYTGYAHCSYTSTKACAFSNNGSVYYNAVAAMAGTEPVNADANESICPKGWHLPSQGDIDELLWHPTVISSYFRSSAVGVYEGNTYYWNDGATFYWTNTQQYYGSSMRFYTTMRVRNGNGELTSSAHYTSHQIRCIQKD